jgi:DNA-binding MarR family transcriptional regulator
VREILEVKFLDEVSPEALTLSQLHLLQLIALNGTHQVGQAAEFLGVSPPAATKNIDKLERLGLVHRVPSDDDRRATLLESSARGRKLVESYEELKKKRLAPVLEAFEEKEIDQLTDLLERFSLLLIGREDEESDLCLRCAAHFDDHCPISRIGAGCPYHRLRWTGDSVHATAEKHGSKGA